MLLKDAQGHGEFYGASLGTDGRARLIFYQMAISRIVVVALCLLVFVF
jgi:hypothetical protein